MHCKCCYPITVNNAKVINLGYSHISEPAQELHSRASPSVRGNITTQLVQPRGEIPEEGRKKKKKKHNNCSLMLYKFQFMLKYNYIVLICLINYAIIFCKWPNGNVKKIHLFKSQKISNLNKSWKTELVPY